MKKKLMSLTLAAAIMLSAVFTCPAEELKGTENNVSLPGIITISPNCDLPSIPITPFTNN